MKKNLAKKALLPALAMALASVIALSGVTYAWFTTGTTASVESLDVNVQTANGIQVSLDAQTWKSVITVDDILAAIGGATAYVDRSIQVPANAIAPMSSAGNVVDGKMQMFYGAYNENGNLDSVAQPEENGTGGNFIAFDLFFKASGENELTLNVGTAMSEVKCINLDANGVASEVGTDTAVRVAFVPMGTKANEDDARALTVASGEALIWEPNDLRRNNGTLGGNVEYSGFKTGFQNIAENALGESQVQAVDTFNESTVITTLDAGITKVRVYIWLEGQDIDCVNSISNGDFSVNLMFSVPKATTEESTEG